MAVTKKIEIDGWSDGGVPRQRSRSSSVPHQIRPGHLKDLRSLEKSVGDNDEAGCTEDCLTARSPDNLSLRNLQLI